MVRDHIKEKKENKTENGVFYANIYIYISVLILNFIYLVDMQTERRVSSETLHSWRRKNADRVVLVDMLRCNIFTS